MESIITRSNISFADIQNEFNPEGANKARRDPISINDYYYNNANINVFTASFPDIPSKGSAISLSNFIGKKKYIDTDWIYTSNSTYKWICPPGVTSVNVVCIGSGGRGHRYSAGGGGGGLAWVNKINVTAGREYTVFVGGFGNNSYFINQSVIYGGAGGESKSGSGSFDTYSDVNYIASTQWWISWPNTIGNNIVGPCGGGGVYGGSGTSYGGGNGTSGVLGYSTYSGRNFDYYPGPPGNTATYIGNGVGQRGFGTGLIGIPDPSGNIYGAGFPYNSYGLYGNGNGVVRIMYSTVKSNKSFPYSASLSTNVYTNVNPI